MAALGELPVGEAIGCARRAEHGRLPSALSGHDFLEAVSAHKGTARVAQG